MAHTLKNSFNPLALYHQVFVEHEIKPCLESHRRIAAEHLKRDTEIIQELEAARRSAQYARDCRWGWLNEQKIVGEPAHEERQAVYTMNGGGLPTEVYV